MHPFDLIVFKGPVINYRERGLQNGKNSGSETFAVRLPPFSIPAPLFVGVKLRVPTAQRKQGKWPKRNSLLGKTQGNWKFCQNTRNFVCSSCKLPDSKLKDIVIFAANISNLFLEAGYVCQVSFVYVIVTTYVNWHRDNLWWDRDKNKNTGNFKMQIRWGP